MGDIYETFLWNEYEQEGGYRNSDLGHSPSNLKTNAYELKSPIASLNDGNQINFERNEKKSPKSYLFNDLDYINSDEELGQLKLHALNSSELSAIKSLRDRSALKNDINYEMGELDEEYYSEDAPDSSSDNEDNVFYAADVAGDMNHRTDDAYYYESDAAIDEKILASEFGVMVQDNLTFQSTRESPVIPEVSFISSSNSSSLRDGGAETGTTNSSNSNLFRYEFSPPESQFYKPSPLTTNKLFPTTTSPNNGVSPASLNAAVFEALKDNPISSLSPKHDGGNQSHSKTPLFMNSIQHNYREISPMTPEEIRSIPSVAQSSSAAKAMAVARWRLKQESVADEDELEVCEEDVLNLASKNMKNNNISNADALMIIKLNEEVRFSNYIYYFNHKCLFIKQCRYYKKRG